MASTGARRAAGVSGKPPGDPRVKGTKTAARRGESARGTNRPSGIDRRRCVRRPSPGEWAEIAPRRGTAGGYGLVGPPGRGRPGERIIQTPLILGVSKVTVLSAADRGERESGREGRPNPAGGSAF